MKNKFKMTLGFFLVILLLSGCVQTSQNVDLMNRNFQETTEYDGIWQLKMYVGPKCYRDTILVANGQIYKRYPSGSAIKGYISGDEKFTMYQTFNNGGWNAGSFSFTLDKETSTTTRLVGKWSGLDSAYKTVDGKKYGGGKWEVTIIK